MTATGGLCGPAFAEAEFWWLLAWATAAQAIAIIGAEKTDGDRAERGGHADHRRTWSRPPGGVLAHGVAFRKGRDLFVGEDLS
jgi:hypothetical protein